MAGMLSQSQAPLDSAQPSARQLQVVQVPQSERERGLLQVSPECC
jgi:hypothetical protein